jgi:Mce-associated membrane protein
MPPTRRRRPVQPATRVRLPRAARPAPGHPATPNGTAEADPADATVDEVETAAAGPHVTEAGTGTGKAGAGTDETVDETVQPDESDDDEPWDNEIELPAAAAGKRAAAGKDTGAAKREPLLLPVCLGVATVLLGGLAVWFGVNTGSSPSTSSGFGAGGTNSALTDTAATSQVNQQIDNAVDTIFSYNYTDTAKTAQAAKSLLTGRASGEYATLFKVVQQDAPSEKLVLTTTVTNSGVEMLNGNTARLLIFANQKDTGSAKGSTTDAGAMFAVTAVRQGNQWKIEDINTFGANG